MSNERGRRSAVVVVAATVVLGGFAYLMFGGLENNVVYFWTPAELLAKGAAAHNRAVRLGGQVAPGSVKWDANALDLTFKVSDGAKEVFVHSKGAPPQMFRDGMGVVVEGKYSPEGVFESNNLMIKHSEEYRAPKPGEKPQEMYKSLIKGVNAS